MATTAEDMRVKLSAEGVDEVVRALAKVQAAAQKTGKEGSAGMKLLNGVMEHFNEIVAGITVGLVVKEMVDLTKGAFETADAIGKLSQKTGISAETLSGLKVAAATADVSFEQLSKGLVKFNKFQGEVQDGSKKALEDVKKLFGNEGALTGLNTEQRLIKTAEAIGRMPAGMTKTATAMAMFGKSGADLIPLFNDLAQNGVGSFIEKAREMGVLIDTDFARAAQQANDSIKELKMQVQGAATQFASGLAPAVSYTAGELKKMAEAPGLKKFGEFVGDLVADLVAGFELIANAAKFVVDQAVSEFDYMFKSLKAMATFNFAEVDRLGKKLQQEQAQQVNDFHVGWAQIMLRRASAGSSGGGALPPPEGGGGPPPPDKAAAKAAFEARKAAIDEEIKLIKKAAERELEDETLAHERGVTGVEAYYAARRATIEAETAKEIEALQRKRAVIANYQPEDAAGAIAKKRELAAVDAQIQEKRIEGQRAELKNDDELTKAKKKLQEETATAEIQYLELIGNHAEAAKKRIEALGQKLKDEHLDPATVDKLTAAMTQKAGFDEISRKGDLAFSELGIEKGNIESDNLFPAEAAEKYRQAIEAALPAMRAYSATLTAIAENGTEEQQQKAAAFALKVKEIGDAANYAKEHLKQFASGLESGLKSDLANFFDQGIQKAHNFKDAMRELGISVLNTLKSLAAQALANMLVEKAINAFRKKDGGAMPADPAKAAAAGVAQAAPLALAGGIINQAGKSIQQGGEQLMEAALMLIVANSMKSASSFADGGYVAGPGTGTSDSIAANLSNGEYVIRAARVAMPGMLEHLNAINYGAQPISYRARSSFADGGLVLAGAGAAAGGGGMNGQVTVGLEAGLIATAVREAMSGPAGAKLIVEHLANNQKKAGQALGIR